MDNKKSNTNKAEEDHPEELIQTIPEGDDLNQLFHLSQTKMMNNIQGSQDLANSISFNVRRTSFDDQDTPGEPTQERLNVATK